MILWIRLSILLFIFGNFGSCQNITNTNQNTTFTKTINTTNTNNDTNNNLTTTSTTTTDSPTTFDLNSLVNRLNALEERFDEMQSILVYNSRSQVDVSGEFVLEFFFVFVFVCFFFGFFKKNNLYLLTQATTDPCPENYFASHCTLTYAPTDRFDIPRPIYSTSTKISENRCTCGRVTVYESEFFDKKTTRFSSLTVLAKTCKLTCVPSWLVHVETTTTTTAAAKTTTTTKAWTTTTTKAWTTTTATSKALTAPTPSGNTLASTFKTVSRERTVAKTKPTVTQPSPPLLFEFNCKSVNSFVGRRCDKQNSISKMKCDDSVAFSIQTTFTCPAEPCLSSTVSQLRGMCEEFCPSPHTIDQCVCRSGSVLLTCIQTIS